MPTKSRKSFTEFGTPVLVEWLDVQEQNGWIVKEDIVNCNLASCRSIGFVVKHNKKSLVLATTLANDGLYAARLAIPNGSILRIKSLMAFSKENKKDFI